MKKNNKNRLMLIALLLFTTVAFTQTEIEGVEFANTIQIENDKASLSGAGIRNEVFTNVYAIGLYHNESTTNAYKVIQSGKPMGVKIQVLSRFLPRTKYVTTLKEGFRNSTLDNTKPIKTKIDHFFGLLDENLGRGDVLKFLYHPDSGVKVYTNGELKGVVKGYKFKEALYGIWLSYPMVDRNLRGKMLGVDSQYVSN